MIDDLDTHSTTDPEMESQPAPSSSRPAARKWILGTIATAILLAMYLVAVRASHRIVVLVDVLTRNSPVLLLLATLAGVVFAQFASPASRQVGVRIRNSFAIRIVVATTGLALCITPALTSWLHARWAYSKIAGVVPWSDANGYHVGGMQLLDRGQLDALNMRRPLIAGFYAVRLLLTGQNFWAMLLLQGILVGLSALLFLKVVANHFGLTGCAVAAAILFAFVGPLIDLMLSESLGMALGCLGAAALVEGVTGHRSWLFSLGLLMFTIGLNFRAGAYLVLPALLVWLAVDTFRSRGPFWKPVLTGVGAVVGGFVLVLPLTALYGTGTGSMNGNFSYTLYGLAHGGTGWTSVYEEFDPKDFATEADLTDAIYDAAIDEIRSHPAQLVRGIVSGYSDYFEKGIYGFADSPVSWIAIGLMLIGWVPLLDRKRDPRLGTMLLVAWVGFMLSIPILFGDGRFRVLAVVVPILAIPPAAGVSWIARRGSQSALGATAEAEGGQSAGSAWPIAAACVGSLTVLIVGPPIAVALYDSLEAPAVKCPLGEMPVAAEMGRDVAHITVLSEGRHPRNFGEMTNAQFHADPQYGGIEIGPALSEISAGSVLVDAYNLIPGERSTALVVVPEAQYPGDRQMVTLCGRPSGDPVAANYGLMFTNHVEVVDP